MTTKELKALVSESLKRNGLINPFKDDIPGDEWLRGFRKRNGLSQKNPQTVEIARKRACNPYTVYEYFDLLEKVLRHLNLTEKPERIYNLDETSFCSDPSKTSWSLVKKEFAAPELLVPQEEITRRYYWRQMQSVIKFHHLLYFRANICGMSGVTKINQSKQLPLLVKRVGWRHPFMKNILAPCFCLQLEMTGLFC